MKTVTDSFETAQRRPGPTGVRRVYYKRRYWDEGDRAYVWESSWTELPNDEVMNISSVNWQLDTEQLNEFKVSNVTLLLDNKGNKWRTDNPDGVFGPDDASPTYGYESHLMKFKVEAGFRLADGTEELVPVFSGLLTEPVAYSDRRAAQLQIQGLETILMNATAEDIATVVTEEDKGLGNGATTEFTTTNPGVGGVRLVSLNGTTKVEGLDYTVSQLNESASGAKVTFSVAPSGAQRVRISYFYWPQDQTFKEVVEALLDAAGIPAADQLVEPIVFANNIQGTQTYDLQADWDTGTKTLMEASSSPGDIKPDYEGAAAGQATTWSTSLSGWLGTSPNSWLSDGTYIYVKDSDNTNSLVRETQNVTGRWSFKYTDANNGASCRLAFTIMVQSVSSGGGVYFPSGGYTARLNLGASQGTVELLRGGTTLGSSPITNNSSEHTLLITRTGAGRIRVYVDTVLLIEATDTTYTAGNYVAFTRTASVASTGDTQVRNIEIPADTITATWESPAIDASGTPAAWGIMDHEEDEDGATITFQTKSSADNVTYGAYVAISSGNIPQADLLRYSKIKVTITFSSVQSLDPFVSSIVFRFVTTSTNITLPAFTGLSVYEAIQKLGEFSNYEFGFTPDEDFFFRPKTAGSSVMSLSSSDFIERAGPVSPGDENFYGIVRAVYGDFAKEITDDGQSPNSPVARGNNRRFTISPDDSIQIPSGSDIASGVAEGFYRFLSVRRKRLTVSTKFVPQLDLSDVVTVTFVDNTPARLWYLGDGTVELGQQGIHLWGEREQLAYNLACKVLACRYDLQNFKCEFELEEVI